MKSRVVHRFPVQGLGFWDITPIMENQMEKNVENEIDNEMEQKI